MCDDKTLKIPDYFPQEEIAKQPVSYNGLMEGLTKVFDGVEVTYSSSSRNGLFLTFRNLKTGDSMMLSPDYEDANKVIHLILKGNSALW